MNRAYPTRPTVLHRLDSRLKVAGLLLFSLMLSSANPSALFIMTVFVTTLALQSRFNGLKALWSSRPFLLLLILMVLSRALFTPDGPLLKWGPLTFSMPGLIAGATICWRLLLMVWLGLWLMAVTRSDEINAAIRWFLRPVPFVNANTVGMMLSFLLRFITMIINEHRHITLAGRARLIDRRRDPVYRIRHHVIPLMRNLFKTIDQLALAMTSRCYSADRTDPEFAFQKRDWVALLVLFLMGAAMIGTMFFNV